MLHQLSKLIASGLGSGYSPKMPGTCGTLVALPFVWIIFELVDFNVVLQLCAALLITLLGTWATFVCMTKQNSSLKDPQWIVIDEWSGIFITFIGITSFHICIVVTGFILFRFFDMLKPGPIKWAERLPGAIGVMADDVVAGVCAWGMLQVILFSIGSV